MPRQKIIGAPSAPSPLPSPSTLQPPQIIVLPTNESNDDISISPTRRYGEEIDMASQDQSTKGIDTDNDIESLKYGWYAISIDLIAISNEYLLISNCIL